MDKIITINELTKILNDWNTLQPKMVIPKLSENQINHLAGFIYVKVKELEQKTIVERYRNSGAI